MVSAFVSQQAVDAIGYLGGALLAGCFVPQIYQLLATRSVQDISITWSLLYNGGLILTTVYLIFKDAPGAWLPSIFELAGGLLVLGLKLFFEHTAVGRRMTAARLQQQQEQEQQEQQALEEQEQQKLDQQLCKHVAASPTLDLHLNTAFSDDSAASSVVLEFLEDGHGSSSNNSSIGGGREPASTSAAAAAAAAAAADPAAGQSPRQRSARKPPGLLLRLPTQRLNVDIRTAYPLSPLACQSVSKLKLHSPTARHASAPGGPSIWERAAAHAAGTGQPSHLLDGSRLQGSSAALSPNTPRAATVAGGVTWGSSSVSEAGVRCPAFCTASREASRRMSGGGKESV